MFLYLMRHGEAVKAGGEIRSDAERALTEYGRMQVRTIAQELKRRRISAGVVSSPYLRAVQTAEILVNEIGTMTLTKDPDLASTGHAPDLAALLKRHSGVQNLILVGHQPDIGMLVEQIIGFELGFGTAVLAGFESGAEQKWRYLWSLIPEDLFHK